MVVRRGVAFPPYHHASDRRRCFSGEFCGSVFLLLFVVLFSSVLLWFTRGGGCGVSKRGFSGAVSVRRRSLLRFGFSAIGLGLDVDGFEVWWWWLSDL
jgi:hypothetical protein